ncbi:MAG: hypothetical protein Q9165_006534 [Trypethelium subeluteriae]
MSFGFGVGDVLAVLSLLERVIIEIRHFKQAPLHFQQLQVELELLRNTLSQILKLQPENVVEFEFMGRIRAITLLCHRALEVFIDKMISKSHSLGCFRTANTLSSMGARLHWSMVARKDVSELRDVIISMNTSILMLLGMLQITRMKTIAIENQGFRDELSQNLTTITQAIQATPEAIADLSDVTKVAARNHYQYLQNIGRDTESIRVKAETTDRRVERTANSVSKLSQSVAHTSVSLLSAIMTLRNLIKILLKRSQNVLDAVTRNARLILDIHAQMTDMMRLVSAISPQITPPIIQLDDACGQTWALPLQACSDWASFTNVLRAVVYPPGKPGYTSIALERFVISHADSGRIIQRNAWMYVVKDRLHIENAMLVTEQAANRNQCPYPACFGKLVSESGEALALVCAKCERRVKIELKDVRLLDIFIENWLDSLERRMAPIPRRSKQTTLCSWPITRPLPSETASNFRRMHLFQHRDPIASVQEAQEILKGDYWDARANLFMGWHSLTSNADGSAAISFFERAIDSEITGDSQFLIVCAFEIFVLMKYARISNRKGKQKAK